MLREQYLEVCVIRTEVVPAHLCIELKFGEGVTVAAGSLKEPVADRLIHNAFGSAAANDYDAFRITP